MKPLKFILILTLIPLSFFLIKSFVYSTTDPSIHDYSEIPLESDPRNIAINPYTDQAVVVGEKPNAVTIIDLNTEEILHTIHIGKKPRGVAIDSKLNIALVSSKHDDTVSVIDLNTMKLMKRIRVGESPRGIAINERTHTALVANHEDDNVSVIDLGTYRLIKKIKVGKEPRDVAIDPELNLALVVGESKRVNVIDLSTYQLLESIPLRRESRAISINPETHLAAVANDEEDTIAVINLQNGETHFIRVDKHPIDVVINPLDNRALVLCNKERSLLLIDLNTNTILANYPLHKRSRGVAVNPFTNVAAVVDDKTDSVTLIELPNPVPVITSISPSALPRGSKGIRILIEGSGFIKTSTVSIFNSTLYSLPLNFIDNHRLEVIIPDNLFTKADIYKIVVANPAPDGGQSNPVNLQVNNPVPTLTSLNPSEVMAGTPGLTLTVNGSGLFNDTTVNVNEALRISLLLDQTKLQIQLTAEDLEVGAYLDIAAFNPSPGGGRSNSLRFTVKNPGPSLESLNPPSIIAGSPDFTLTLTGDNFVKTSIASFNNQQYPSRFISKRKIEATISSSAITIPGSCPVKVINPPPGGGESSQLTFTVKPALPPVEPQPEGSFGEQYQDLIPPDVTLQSYDPKRFSLITGLVRNVAGSPIPGVSVTILTQPGYGTARTSAEGRFSIPVEGGGTLTVIYQKEGLLTTHRKVYVPWNDIAIAETIVMIPQDSVHTTLTFDGNPNTVVTHQSTIVTDDRGSRSSTAVFTGDNLAYSVDVSANVIQELTTITTRATEFTTEQSMPAKLPPNSAYTYCVELSVDEAQRVRFDKPVITWVDNFLGFPVGERVPVGYYDRDRGVWVPSDNGVVVRLLDTNNDGIVDALDANGDGLPDDLNGNGSFADEVAGLNNPQRYPPGSTFWRFTVTHFTPWDANWPYGLPIGAIAPNPKGITVADVPKEETKSCNSSISSFVEERSRIFHEDIPIPGTDFTLHYTSSRVRGYYQQITVPASGDAVPANLKRIIVQLTITGRSFEQILSAQPNQKAEIIWDGLDYLGNPVSRTIMARVEVGFVYDAVYWVPWYSGQAFGQAGGGPTNIPARQEVTSWRQNDIEIEGKPKEVLAEGWTLSSHHYLSPTDPTTLHKGDGTITKNNAYIIDTVAGAGTGGFSGDGGPATEAQIGTTYGVAVDSLGNIYIADSGNNRIRKVDTNGIITTVAGGGNPPSGLGDGGPATQARLSRVYGVGVDFSGNIYIADTYNNRVRKVDARGIITTVAGNGVAGYSGDGGLATQAQIYAPVGVTADALGNIYIAEYGNYRVRKVDPSGIITTVAGNGIWGFGGDGGPATNAPLGCACGVAVDNMGNLYIADAGNYRIRKVDTSGIITTVAGGGNPPSGLGDGGPATQARLNNPRGVAVDAAGNIYIADSNNNRVCKVDTSGIIITLAGSGTYGYGGDGGPGSEAHFRFTAGVAVSTLGIPFISDSANARIREVAPPSIFDYFITAGDIAFAEEDGQGYILSSAGKHKKTIELNTGIVLYEFGYDQNNKLISIRDRFGNQTIITRNSSGIPTSITSPDGIATTLTIDSNNHLTRISYPDGNFFSFEYNPGGLMTAKVEPAGNRFEHIFDSIGRLTDATDQEGGHWQFSRQVDENGDVLAQTLTAEGNLTSYLDHTDSTGAYTSHITDPSGAETVYTSSSDGLTANKTLPCGTTLSFKYGIDSQYKFQFVKEMRERTTTNLERITLREKAYQDTNTDKVPDLITGKVAVNGKLTTLLSDTLQSKTTMTSPLGRTTTTFYDPNNLLTTKLTVPGFFDTDFGYDTRGRLTSINTNTRQTTFAYDTQGNLSSITDPENRSTSYFYDTVGRMTGIQRSDNTSVGFSYDKSGNMTLLTNPSSVDHGFGYTKVNLNSSYQTPLSGRYSYLYNRDRRLLEINFPSGKQIKNIYDKDRIIEIQTPGGNINLNYLCGSKVGSISKGTEVISYGYDGSLVTSENLSGALNQSLNYSYNNDFNLSRFTYAGSSVNYTYDSDGLLIGAGGFTITRNAGNGLPEAVTGDGLNLTRTFNGYGEVQSQNFNVNGLSLTSWGPTRDKTGRIISKTETVEGITSNYIYTYDSLGRLLTVTKDNNLVEEYQYGPNGNRTYEMNLLKGISGRTYTYSDEDHLLTAGDIGYQFDLDGFLTNKTNGTNITIFVYSSRGELLSVILPDGRLIEYINDPLGRRIAKKIDGLITEKYLWQGLTRLLAVYDGSDNLIMRFEYVDDRIPLTMAKDGSTYYLTYDQVGSLSVVADSSGNVIKRIDYDSFGSIINDTNPGFQVPFGFAGGLHDKDTGLVRFGFRDYDPEVGRWTGKDPILFTDRDIDLYGYCLNNPINWIDPNGLSIEHMVAIIGDLVHPGGLGSTIGFAVGVTIGFVTFQVPGAIVFGAAGLVIGGYFFDQPGAGQLNYQHDLMLEHYREMAEAKWYFSEWERLREQLEEWNRRTGGSFDVVPCQ